MRRRRFDPKYLKSSRGAVKLSDKRFEDHLHSVFFCHRGLNAVQPQKEGMVGGCFQA